MTGRRLLSLRRRLLSLRRRLSLWGRRWDSGLELQDHLLLLLQGLLLCCHVLLVLLLLKCLSILDGGDGIHQVRERGLTSGRHGVIVISLWGYPRRVPPLVVGLVRLDDGLLPGFPGRGDGARDYFGAADVVLVARVT